jgi:hypothetical protein
MYHRQQFPIVVNMGNGLGQSIFLMTTFISGQEDWSASSNNHYFEAHSCEHFSKNGPFWRLVQDNHFLRKLSGQSLPRADSFSPGCTFFSARGMAQIGQWSRFNNQGQAFPREDSVSLGFTLFSARGMAQIGNGPGSEIGTIILPCLRRIVQIDHH